MYWRHVFGLVTFVGYLLLVWDLLTVGSRETRTAIEPTESRPLPEAAVEEPATA